MRTTPCPGGGSTVLNYTYDNTGLRTGFSSDDDRFAPLFNTMGTNNNTPNTLNQYTQSAGETLTYDGNGNLTGDGTNTYTYDAANQMTAANGDTYAYDPFGRRRTKTVDSATTTYIYAGDQAIAEYGASGLEKKFVYGPGIDEPIFMNASETMHYYHADALGSVIAMTDGAGAVAETYRYTAFGQVDAACALGNPYLYTGRRLDPETGLYYYRARYYDAGLRRFLQTDPIGYDGGMNLYAYVLNNPIIFIDPFGLEELFNRIRPERWILQQLERGDDFRAISSTIKDFYGQNWTQYAWLVDKLNFLQKQWDSFGMTNCPGAERHHYLPKENKSYFSEAGLDIEDYTACVPRGEHRLKKEKGMHTNQKEHDWKNWNTQWDEYRKTHGVPDANDIKRELRQMMFEHAIMLQSK